MAKVVHLPSSKLTPKVLLHQLLQNVEDIESLVVVVQNKETEINCNWSNMSTAELCLSLVVLQGAVQDCLEGD